MKQRSLVFGLLSAAALCAATTTHAADTVLRNGTIYTVNDKQPWAEALAIRDGKIVFVGSNAGAVTHIRSGTEVIDLEGLFVMPGIHDVHTHPLEANNNALAECNLKAGLAARNQLKTIRRCSKEQKGNAWVTGWGHYIEDVIRERSPAKMLDQAVPDRPAIMMEFTSHSMWVNSKALKAAGITARTPNPPGGVIVRDKKTGEPNGLLIDNVGNMIWELPLKPNRQILDLTYDGLKVGLKKLARNGITSISDARVYWTRKHHEVWQRAEREKTLTARVVMSLWAYPQFGDEQIETLEAMYSNDPGRLLKASQIKVYSDGIVSIGTAAMKRRYAYDYGLVKGNRGLNYFDQDRLTRYIARLEKTGFDFHIHAIGDRGVHEALNAIEEAGRINGSTLGRRHRLTHVELVDKADIPRFKRLGVIADFQVAGSWSNPGEYKRDTGYLIGKRANAAIPLKSIYDTGATVTLSSDYDVSTMNPFIGMQHARSRGRQKLPSMDAVVRAYTINGAYTLRQEEITGSLEVGKYADLIVLDQNLLEVKRAHIGRTRVLWTLLAGEEVFRHKEF
ncbi:MAG: amidohydrolase [Pseudomonadota bacterium]